MKLRLSYFYQIRNFKPNMIPMSTALSDPAWYHDFKDKDYIFARLSDKNVVRVFKDAIMDKYKEEKKEDKKR